ncbi:MAG: hypothetical protein HOP33_19125 [Verrucomicrobia bacterium]|nr:hypothetical protein [Verrucomicrobiota bacterium]
MSAQVQLKMFQAERYDPNVRELEQMLFEYQGWMSSSLIGSKTGWNSDKVNNLARVSADIISGQLGYKHIQHATAAEQAHYANGLTSRIRELGKRLVRYRKRAHQLLS